MPGWAGRWFHTPSFLCISPCFSGAGCSCATGACAPWFPCDRHSLPTKKAFRDNPSTPCEGDAVQVQPYLFFNGRCEEAVNFYRKTLGAEVETLMRFKDSPDPAMCAPGTLDKIMHGSIRIGDATVLVSDGRCEGEPKFQGFA